MPETTLTGNDLETGESVSIEFASDSVVVRSESPNTPPMVFDICDQNCDKLYRAENSHAMGAVLSKYKDRSDARSHAIVGVFIIEFTEPVHVSQFTVVDHELRGRLRVFDMDNNCLPALSIPPAGDSDCSSVEVNAANISHIALEIEGHAANQWRGVHVVSTANSKARPSENKHGSNKFGLFDVVAQAIERAERELDFCVLGQDSSDRGIDREGRISDTTGTNCGASDVAVELSDDRIDRDIWGERIFSVDGGGHVLGIAGEQRFGFPGGREKDAGDNEYDVDVSETANLARPCTPRLTAEREGGGRDAIETSLKTQESDKLEFAQIGPRDVFCGSYEKETKFVDYFDGAKAIGAVNSNTSEIETSVPCFTPGTSIATPRGETLVEDLQVGDAVITRDNGIQEIRWIGAKNMDGRQLQNNPHLQPILLQKGSLGNDLPERDMLVSPNHRMLVGNDRVSLYFDEHEVLVAAKHLLNPKAGVQTINSMGTTYIHFMFDKHEVVLANGAWSESFQPSDYTLKGMGNAQRNEIFELFPELQGQQGQPAFASARLTLKKHEAKMLSR